MNRAAQESTAVVITDRSDRDVLDTIGVEVADSCDRDAEKVAVVECCGESAGGVADLLLGDNVRGGGRGRGVEVVGLAVAVGVLCIARIAVGVGVSILGAGENAVAVVV